MSVEQILKEIFNPAASVPVLCLFVGGTCGLAISSWYTKRSIKILEDDNKRIREDLGRKERESDQQKTELTGQKYTWECEKADLEIRLKAAQAKIRTITCSICGSSVRRVGPNGHGGIILKCSDQNCGDEICYSSVKLSDMAAQLAGLRQ